jgi:hypothetical protein
MSSEPKRIVRRGLEKILARTVTGTVAPPCVAVRGRFHPLADVEMETETNGWRLDSFMKRATVQNCNKCACNPVKDECSTSS